MKKIPVWKNILLIFSLIVAIIIATFAWFVTSPYGGVDALDLNVGEASFIQISSDDGNHWSEGLEMEIGINKNFKEVSGDGTTFFEPVYDVVENSAGELTSVITTFEKAKGQYYYEQTFSLRSDGSKYVYLSPESYVKANADDQSAFIDGAIRVAFYELDEDGHETLKFIWAPNSTIQYSKDTNTCTKNGNVERYYYYQKTTTPVSDSALESGVANPNVAVIPTAGSGSCAACGYSAANKFMWSCGEHMPENAPYLTTIEGGTDGDFGYAKMKIRVWLEGHDRECVSLIQGQKFTMKFQFDSGSGE